MHSYLKAVGFSDIFGKKELDSILNNVINEYDEKIVAAGRAGHFFTELVKKYGDDFGIVVCGEYDENNEFQMEYYFPYFFGTGITLQEEVIIEKHAGHVSFAGACDDMRIGVTIIFYLQNAGEYLTQRNRGNYVTDVRDVILSGLAKNGKILFPTLKQEGQEENRRNRTMNRGRLIAAAKNGDEEAMESLTIEDMDMYAMISKRVMDEDISSIVDTYFMPYGAECDQYSILGEILKIRSCRNERTGTELYVFTMDVNELQFDVCVPRNSIFGVPEVGRRFKANIWLQGIINFQ